jgi:HlyD family secretion protein
MIKKYGMYLFIAILFAIAAVMIYIKINPKKLPQNLISATGKIDGDLIMLNTKYPGRIQTIAIKDGQKIKENELVAVLTSKEYEKKLDALDAGIRAANDELKAMQNKLQITQSVVTLNIKKAQKAVEIAQDEKAQVLSAVKAQKAVLKQTQKDYQRTVTLYKKKLIAEQKVEYAHLKLTTDQEKLHSVKEQLNAANKAIEVAKDNHQLSLAQKKRIPALKNNIQAAKNKILALKANKEELQVVIDELTIKSPINGYIIEKIANKGEVLGAGTVIATLVNPKNLYLQVFIDTINNGKIKIGDNAVIFLDAYPNKAIKAKVINIAAHAEFTPKNVAVKSDRIQRVFAVRLHPLHVNPFLKLGIPAIGVISIDGKGLPSSLHNIPSI